MSDDGSNEIDFAEFLKAIADGAARGARTWIPGRIESFDSATCRAVVQPLLLEGDKGQDGARIARRLAAMTDVPVWFLGAGGFRVRFPIDKGDNCILLFAARSLDKYKALGVEVDPEDDRHHDPSDCIAIPADLAKPHAKNAGAFIEFTDSEIKCGGNNRLVTKAEFDGHTHGPGTFAAGSTNVLGISGGAASVTGTAQLRGFITLGLLVMLGYIATLLVVTKVLG